ncbi:hypothetical protein THIOM_000760 [Candidatus Thiomargarita nelsonii]|uniref:Uncharacterized protein n=1 Tax=Candidatus Thiomargarita nelsonii TaxID=1003181 RepID=A0A176S5M6_9GAMM|nr:hypothetical protein THIOM_000760 [Candidatus Thiomargarita nelsonii]
MLLGTSASVVPLEWFQCASCFWEPQLPWFLSNGSNMLLNLCYIRVPKIRIKKRMVVVRFVPNTAWFFFAEPHELPEKTFMGVGWVALLIFF